MLLIYCHYFYSELRLRRYFVILKLSPGQRPLFRDSIYHGTYQTPLGSALAPRDPGRCDQPRGIRFEKPIQGGAPAVCRLRQVVVPPLHRGARGNVRDGSDVQGPARYAEQRLAVH